MLENIAATGPTLEPELVTIRQAGAFVGLSRGTMYELIAQKKLQAVKAGKRLLVRVSSLKSYAASLPPAKIAPRAKPRKVTYRRKRSTRRQ